MKSVKVILLAGLLAIAAMGPTFVRAQQLAPPQSVTLAWSASPESSVTGYNLYYGDVSSSLTNKLNVGPALTATVTNLQVGTGYFFFATAYDASAVESEPSNLITYTPTVTTYPDLVINSVNCLPASPVAGNPVRFSAVVANQGAAAFPAGLNVRLSFSVNGAPAVASAYLTNALLPGASTTVAAAASTWTAVAGVHSVTATVDDLGALIESGETNNQFQISLSVSPAPLPLVSVAVDKPTVIEGDATGVLVTVARAGNGSGDLPVALSFAGSARNGIDYASLPATIVIPAGNLAGSFRLIPIRNGIVDEGRSVSLGLVPNADYQIGSPDSATILIANDDAVPPVNSPTQSVTLAWSPSPDSSVVGYNLYYGEVSATLTNKLNVGPALTATVTNLQVGVIYFFFATAYDASGVESEPSNFITYTVSPAAAPMVSITLNKTTVAEGDSGGARIVIQRSGNIAGALSVGLRIEGSAANGVDYLAVPETIVIPAGTNSVTLRLVPIPNGLADGGRSVILNLVPDSNYQIQSPGSGTILIADQDGDSDGDGMSNAAETLAGTDASDPDSSLKIVSLLPAQTGQMTLNWASVPGITYRVMSRSSLTELGWSPASPSITATGNVTSWTIPATNAAGFFSLSVLSDPGS